jgi:hypothetical protein
MKLLDTTGANAKLAKTNKNAVYKVAGLSLYPDLILCPGSKAAGCMEGCLKSTGFAGVYKSVNESRQRKTDFWHNDRIGFLDQLIRELSNFEKYCKKRDLMPAARLNVLSDIEFEKYEIPQQFPGVYFLDYTKRAARLGNTPGNYQLMFSYSGRAQYAAQVSRALKHDCPVAVVFRGGFPASFMGRPVINGDASDLVNSKAGPVIIGLKAKGAAANADAGGFVIDNPDLIKGAA